MQWKATGAESASAAAPTRRWIPPSAVDGQAVAADLAQDRHRDPLPEALDRVGGTGDHKSPGPLAEQGRLEGVAAGQAHCRAQPTGEASLGQRGGQAALGDVVGAAKL